jgi:hypothetical protein
MGTKWATGKRSAVLGVPSVVIPSELNFLLNPEHPDFSKIEIGNPKPVGWDPRLLALLRKIRRARKSCPSSRWCSKQQIDDYAISDI